MKFDQKKYISDYNKANYKMYQFRVKKNSEIMKVLDNVKNRNNYILSLIEKDRNNTVLTIKQIKNIIIPILNKYNIHEIYLFGSYSRGEANNDSDVDIYCEQGNISTYIDQGKMENELVKALGKNVDVIFTTNQMSDSFNSRVKEDLIKLC